MFAAEHNWCDNRCERCPIARRCPVARAVAQEGPSGSAPSVDALDRALVALRAQLADLAVTDDATVPSERAARLNELSRQYFAGLIRVGKLATETHPEAGPRLAWDALLAVRKCAFLTVYFEPAPPGLEHEEDGFAESGAPLVMLLEIVGASLAEDLRAIFEPSELAAFEVVHVELARLLQPLTDRVTPELRAEMARRVAVGEAPSPFAVVD